MPVNSPYSKPMEYVHRTVIPNAIDLIVKSEVALQNLVSTFIYLYSCINMMTCHIINTEIQFVFIYELTIMNMIIIMINTFCTCI